MSQEIILQILQSGIWTVIIVAAPPLLIGLAVGLLVSIFQAVTSIQEQTLSFVPKILAVFLALLIFGSWMLNLLADLITELYTNLGDFLLQ